MKIDHEFTNRERDLVWNALTHKAKVTREAIHRADVEAKKLGGHSDLSHVVRETLLADAETLDCLAEHFE